MTAIHDFIDERGITEVLHFTTNHGLVGIFDRGAVLSRDALNADDHLEDVKLLNCPIRRDPDWTGHVNLSISVVNGTLLNISSGKWHAPRDGLWWAVLSFSPELMADDDVVFATTNNVYPVVQRGTGVDALRALYTDHVPWGYYGSVIPRRSSTPPERPTDVQAEVLYPRPLGLERLQAIYVPRDEHIDDIEGFMASIPGAPQVPVSVRAEVFQ